MYIKTVNVTATALDVLRIGDRLRAAPGTIQPFSSQNHWSMGVMGKGLPKIRRAIDPLQRLALDCMRKGRCSSFNVKNARVKPLKQEASVALVAAF
jgi:hypothetical protein